MVGIKTSGFSPPTNVSGFSDGTSCIQGLPNMAAVALMNPLPLDQASKHARKVYIGNLPPSVTQEIVIAQFFNHTLAALLPNKPPGDSIIGTYINTTKRFAFIENRSIEETTFTLGLDGIMMEGYALKLRRPQDYNAALAQQQLAVEMQLKGGISALRGAASLGNAAVQHNAAAASIVSTSVDDGPNKVFIGGLPHHMMEAEVKELLSTFGPLKAFHLVKDREADRSKGYAFCEWRDATITDLACAQLNGTKVGDRYLNVRRAIGHSAHRQGIEGGLPFPALTNIPPATIAPILIADIPGDPPIIPQVIVRVTTVLMNKVDLPPISRWLNGETPSTSRCIALSRLSDDIEVDADRWASLVIQMKLLGAQVGFVRACVFHAAHGGRILTEFSTGEEAAGAIQFFNERVVEGVKIKAVFAELTPELRSASIARIKADVERLTALDSEARRMYLEQEAKIRKQRLSNAVAEN